MLDHLSLLKINEAQIPFLGIFYGRNVELTLFSSLNLPGEALWPLQSSITGEQRQYLLFEYKTMADIFSLVLLVQCEPGCVQCPLRVSLGCIQLTCFETLQGSIQNSFCVLWLILQNRLNIFFFSNKL